MNKMIAGIILAGLVVFPRVGMTVPPSPGFDPGAKERIAKAVADTEKSYQQGLADKAAAQKAADDAKAAVVKAQADLKAAQASGDRRKIAMAERALARANAIAAEKITVLNRVDVLVQRLKIVLDEVKATAASVAQSNDPIAIRNAAREVVQLDNDARHIVISIDVVMAPQRPGDFTDHRIPTTTVSTTKPNPTQDRQLQG